MKKTFLAFSCPHFPEQDPAAIDWLLGRISDYKPDVIVHLGDGHEADSASRWPSEKSYTLFDEFEQHNAFLKDIRNAYRPAERVFMWGNHDDNIIEINRIDKNLRSLVDPNHWEPELKSWKQYPYVYDKRGVYRLGQVSFFHGYEAGQSSDKFQAVALGSPYGLTVSGHTHRPQPVTQVRMTLARPLPYWYTNTGCLRSMKPSFMARKNTQQWGQGCVTGEAQILKSPRVGPCWEARTEVFKTYAQWVDSTVDSGWERG